ncbi:MAG: 50S ribosomal protein L18 [Bacteroidetes bacterium]|nr:50S ribosomal protein L18 [Bacteroidota bacterium]
MQKRDKLRLQRKVSRVRKNIFGTADKPRLTVFRSLNHIYAQLVDDSANRTLASASSKCKEISEELGKTKSKTEKSKIVGKLLSSKAVEVKVSTVIFDRGRYAYHGRVKALADGAREGGLKF